MFLYHEKYDEFAPLVKRHVIYMLMLRILPTERETLRQAKPRLGKAYIEVIEQIEKDIEKALIHVRKQMRSLNGKIVSERQEEFVRVVVSQLEKNTYTHRFANHVLLSESETALLSFVKKQTPTFT